MIERAAKTVKNNYRQSRKKSDKEVVIITYLNQSTTNAEFVKFVAEKKLLLRTEEPFESFFLIKYFVSYRRLSSDELNMNDGDQKYRGSQYLLPLLLGFFPNKFAYWFYKLSCWATPAWILAKLGSHSKGLGGIRKLSIRLQLQNPNAFWLLALEINASSLLLIHC